MDKYIYTILRENVTTFEEKHELDGLTESDSSEVQNQVVINMLKGIGGRRVDFAEIEQSKGRLEKFIGYVRNQDSRCSQQNQGRKHQKDIFFVME